MKTEFWQLPKQQRTNTANRIIQLRRNLEEYQYQVANAKELMERAEFQRNKTEKELQKMLASFVDSDKIPA